ncbi:MAG: class I SAM-dependent methyltransferase [Flavobacteriales bacterium]|nr:class I SAM-dependent methyltransferase [Flavobacteriales bacterium]
MAWYESWFDTKYYHILYKNRDWNEAKKFVSNLVDYLQIPKSAKLLDLACGKGRHSRELNGLGYDVVGIDLSEDSIRKAKEFQNKTLHFQVGDMRKVYFPNEFDVIFNLFTSFGYFETNEENFSVFDAVNKQLKKGGIFVFDYLNSSYVVANLAEQEVKTIEGIEFHITKEIKGGKVIKNIDFNDEGKKHSFQESVRLFKKEELQQALQQRGFNVVSIFGDYDLTKFNQESSHRVIFIAKKNG